MIPLLAPVALATFLASSTITGPPGTLTWQAPVPPPVVVLAPFVAPSAPWAPGHRGVDLKAAPGTPIRAAGPGRVSFADSLAGRFVISIAHTLPAGSLRVGWRTTYEGVRPTVRVGQQVGAGTVIGTLAPQGAHCTCLHWGLRRGREYADPMLLLNRPIVLKPSGARMGLLERGP